MTKLRELYKQVFHFLFVDLKYFMIGVPLFFIAIMIVSWLFFAKNTDAMMQLIDAFREQVENMSDDGKIQFVQLFLNNSRVCLMCLGLGLIPFLFVPALILAGNSALMGAMCALYAMNGLSVGKMLIIGILPHGIFELPAMFLSMGMGLALCLGLCKRITEPKNNQGTVVPMIKNSAISFVLVVIPLLLVAAAVEAFVTGRLLEMFF